MHWCHLFVIQSPSAVRHVLLADVHVLDCLVGLAAGCSIIVAPSQQLKDVEAVAALIQQHSVVSTSFVPSICQPLLEACGGKPLLSSLRHVSIGGEAVRPAAVAAMLAAAPHVALYNIYGAQTIHDILDLNACGHKVASCPAVMMAACMCKMWHIRCADERVLCMCRAH
jgi:non-ribosomal peptide synthetase component F